MTALKTVCLLAFVSSAAAASSYPTAEELNARVRENELRYEQQQKAASDKISREVNERFALFYRTGRMDLDERGIQAIARGTRRSISQAWTQGTRTKKGTYSFKNSVIMTDAGFFCKEGENVGWATKRYDCYEMDGSAFVSFERDFSKEFENSMRR